MVQSFVTFRASFPEDSRWDEEGRLLVAGGQAIVQVLTEALTRRGATCSKPAPNLFLGWNFTATLEGLSVDFVLQFLDRWVLMGEPRRGFLDWVRGRDRSSTRDDLLRFLSEALEGDPRFTEVQAYSTEGPAGSQEHRVPEGPVVDLEKKQQKWSVPGDSLDD